MLKKFYLGLAVVLFFFAALTGCVGTETTVTTTTLETKLTTTTTAISSKPTTTTQKEPATIEETSKVVIKVTDTSGRPLNGLALFEKGWVHSNRFILGALVVNGEATIVLPKVRDIPESEWNYWGMHIYSTDHIYFPQPVLIQPGNNSNVFNVALAKDPNPDDDPIISSLEFEEDQGNKVIKMEVSSPKNILGPQNLAFNTKTGEAFALKPPIPVEDLSADFPNGVYTLTYSKDTRPQDWYFVIADHGCSNGPVQGFPLNENIIPAYVGTEPTETSPPPSGDAVEIGEQLMVIYGCAGCHYFDQESLFEDRAEKVNWLLGPGLQNLFKKDKLPASGLDATEENVIKQIREGGNGMPSFSTLSEEEVSNIIAYLKTL